MFKYDFDRLNDIFQRILRNTLAADAWKWLDQQGNLIRSDGDVSKFNIAFVSMPRKTGKNTVMLSAQEESALEDVRKGLYVTRWTVDRLARVWLLMQLSPVDKTKYL